MACPYLSSIRTWYSVTCMRCHRAYCCHCTAQASCPVELCNTACEAHRLGVAVRGSTGLPSWANVSIESAHWSLVVPELCGSGGACRS